MKLECQLQCPGRRVVVWVNDIATANVYETKQIFSGQAMVLFFQFVICFFGAFVILLWNRPLYGWIGAAVSMITFLTMSKLNARLAGFERRALEIDSVLAGDMTDMLHNLSIVRLYKLQPILSRKYACASKQAYQARLRYKFMRGFTDGILDFIAFSAQTLALLAGILQFARGDSAVQIVFASSMYALILSAVRDLGSAVMFMQGGIESAKRMYQLLDKPTEQSCGDESAINADENAVEFRHVTFSYAGEENVLNDVSISVPKGTFTAIVGGSGSGKTTILKLLMGMYNPNQGSICVGGTDITHISKDRLREKIAYIPQEPTLFYGTVRQNVRLWADDGEITAYLRQAAFDLDENTQVGEMGKALSGGEAQRVAIARALAHDADLYILDEPTSALDYETERTIRRVIECDLAGKTRICITHRLNTIVNADHIIVMENGNVVEEGTHSQLLLTGGAYSLLYHKWEET